MVTYNWPSYIFHASLKKFHALTCIQLIIYILSMTFIFSSFRHFISLNLFKTVQSSHYSEWRIRSNEEVWVEKSVPYKLADTLLTLNFLRTSLSWTEGSEVTKKCGYIKNGCDTKRNINSNGQNVYKLDHNLRSVALKMKNFHQILTETQYKISPNWRASTQPRAIYTFFVH
jgi:hypothetical protein